MKRALELPCGEFLIGDSELVVELTQEVVGSVVLEITMMLTGLISQLTLIGEKDSRVAMKLGDQADPADKAVATYSESHGWKFEMARNQIEYFQSCLLRAYRDSMAEVDHIHIEGESEIGPFDLTVFFAAARPPLTPEEAEKLMED